MPLTFGIPTLDELINIPGSEETGHENPKTGKRSPDASSMSLLGPDGSGKSVMALHLASQYRASCIRELQKDDVLPLILYVSSDLQASSARKVWGNFKLDSPFERHIPFERMPCEIERRFAGGHPRNHTIELTPIQPGHESTFNFLLPSEPETAGAERSQVAFLDLARHTAGDDWKFVNSLIVNLEAFELPKRSGVDLSHLVIIDSVAGFETYMGKYDAYGMEHTRRARIAQCMRNAGNHAHLVFVVEEPDDGKRLPEEYVTDMVLRLRMRREGGRALRTVEVEKARARDHAAGEHTFEIRNRQGSSTGHWENPDTPATNNSYVHVFHSLSHRNTLVSTTPGEGRREKTPNDQKVVPFGLRYLDRLLEKQSPADPNQPPNWGIRARSAAALIGDTSTGKSVLGEAFLANGLRDIVRDAIDIYRLLRGQTSTDDKALDRVCYLLSKPVIGGDSIGIPHTDPNCEQRLADAWEDGERSSNLALQKLQNDDVRNRNRATRNLPVGSLDDRIKVLEARASLKSNIRPDRHSGRHASLKAFVSETRRLEKLKLLFRHPNLRAPAILFTTSDRKVTVIAERCLQFLKNNLGNGYDKAIEKDSGLARVLREIIEEQLIVRRFDLDSITAEGLFDMIARNIVQAEYMLFGPCFPTIPSERHRRSDRIRLVIDDMRVLSNLCPSIVTDSAFFPFLTFHLKRVGLTSLIIHTDALRPGMPAAHPVSQVLLALMNQQILTWSVPFEGQSRIAISAIRATSKETNGIVRELELEDPSARSTGGDSLELPRIGVTRHLELYADLEKGEPRLIPLAVLLYAATKACRAYMDREDVLFRAQFRPVSNLVRNGQTGRVLWPIDAAEYFSIRDLTHLPWDVKADHTIVDQVDGFWSLDAENGALASQYEYLTSPADRPLGNLREDSFGLFLGKPLHRPVQGDNQGRYNRSVYFQNACYRARIVNYQLRPGQSERMPDRVPFMWDFSFVLVPSGLWSRAEGKTVPRYFQSAGVSTKPAGPLSVKGVLDGLRQPWVDRTRAISWREFLGACRVVADFGRQDSGVDLQPFDFAATSPETLLSLFLEIWFSEISSEISRRKGSVVAWPKTCAPWSEWVERLISPDYEPLKPGSPDAQKYSLGALLKPQRKGTVSDSFAALRKGMVNTSRKYWNKRRRGGGRVPIDPQAAKLAEALRGYAKLLNGLGNPEGAPALVIEALARWESDPDSKEDRRKLFHALPTAAFCLYKTWQLLQDVMDFSSLLDPSSAFEFKQPKSVSRLAVAARHYYRTACDEQGEEGEKPHAMPAAQYILPMPGMFSVRGDSFLASAQASRSQLLASHAIDLLCSRRANLTRMQMGMGLPVRDVLEPGQCKHMRTALRAMAPGKEKVEEITYEDLCNAGGPPPLETSDENQTRWLYRNGIPEFDRVSRAMQKWLTRLIRWTISYRAGNIIGWDGGLHSYDALEDHRFSACAAFTSFDEFAGLCDYLIAEMQAAERQPSE